MAIFSDGSFVGSVSSGCLEEALVSKALQICPETDGEVVSIDTKKFYGCDGELTILLEPFGSVKLAEICELITQRSPFLLRTRYQTTIGTEVISLQRNHHALQTRDGVFDHPISPAFRLLLVGSGLDAVAIGRVAAAVGVEVIHLLPQGQPLDGGPSGDSKVLDFDNFPTDRYTGAMVMSHQIGRDAACVARLLPSSLRYVGLMGSRRRCSEVVNRAIDLAPDALHNIEKLRAPVGLDLGSETPEEIGLAALAEFMAVMCERSAVPLSEKTGLLHQASTDCYVG